MPGLVERIYAMNPGLAAHGPTLPLGTSFLLPVPAPDPAPDPAQVLAPIRLW
jgi:phage tail protein X